MRHYFVLYFFIACRLLAQNTTIHGVVKDAATGAPLPDFTIQVTEGTTTTDAQGRYVLPHVLPGPVMITARNLRRDTVTHRVDVSANDDLAVDFLIPPNATISGRLVDRENRPVSGTKIWVVQSHSLMGPQITASDGRFSFEYGLVAGRKYYIVADRPPRDLREPPPIDKREPIEAPTYFGDAISLDAAAPIMLRPSEQREIEIKLRKSPYYCVDGKIEVSGTPVKLQFAIHEQALAATSLVRIASNSAPDGTFRVCHLTPGQYRLSSYAPQDLTGAVDFAIADSDVHKIRLSIDPVSLHLELLWDGTPPPEPVETPADAPGPHVTKKGNDWTIVRRVGDGRVDVYKLLAAASPISIDLSGLTSGARSKFVQRAPYVGPVGPDLSAGDYQVQVTMSPPSWYVKELSYNGVPCADRVLHLAPGTSGTLRIVIGQDGGTLSYKVTGSEGRPLPDATILLFTDGAIAASLRLVGPRQGVAPGKYRVLAIDRPVQFPEDLDRVLPAIFQARDIEVGPKATLEVNLQALSID